MELTRGGTSAAALRSVRLAALAGMVAPILFVATFTLEGWLRPGYDPASMFVSELSLGSRGWVQIASFVLTGSLLLLFAQGVTARFLPGRAARVGPVLLRIIGGSLVASGPFVTDPSALFDQISVHGLVHGIFGALVFSLASVSCFVYFRCFRLDPAFRPLAGWTLLAGVILVIDIGFLKVSQVPHNELYSFKGLIQRIFLIVFMAWIYAFAVNLLRHPVTFPSLMQRKN